MFSFWRGFRQPSMVDLLPLFVIYDFESGSLPRIPERQGSRISPGANGCDPLSPLPPFRNV